jgi:hypothetical protein
MFFEASSFQKKKTCQNFKNWTCINDRNSHHKNLLKFWNKTMKKKGEVCKNEKQKKTKHNSKPKMKGGGGGDWKEDVDFEESESDFPTDIKGN